MEKDQKTLKQLRAEIDSVDDNLADLFSARLTLVDQVALVKQEKNMPVADPIREQMILQRLTQNKTLAEQSALTTLFGTIFSLSKERQDPEQYTKNPQKWGLIGRNIQKSLSPLIHRFLGNPDYRIIPLSSKQLASFLRSKEFNGINVTTPYKKTVLPFCNELTLEAAQTGSVNTIVNREGKLIGANTDLFGICFLLDHLGVELKNKKVLVLGSGGASRTVQIAAWQKLARQVVEISRSGFNNYENLSRHFDADILVNATPVGLSVNGSPLSLEGFDMLQAVIDINYINTPLLKQAAEKGIRAANGLSMLIAQAAESHDLFFGTKTDRKQIEFVLERIQKERY